MQDLTSKPKYLVTFTVGYGQKANIDACVKKVGLCTSTLTYNMLVYCFSRAQFGITVFAELYHSSIPL